MKGQLLTKIDNRTAKVAIIGLGYVGLPLAVAFAENGFHVVGVDVDQRKVEALNRGESYVRDVPSARLAPLVTVDKGVAAGTFRATMDYGALDDCDAAIVCVPTPLSKTKDPDMSYILAATDAIAQHLHSGMLVVLESTTYPGTTEELILPRLQHAHGCTYEVGQDFFLAFSPERIDPGRVDYTVENTPKVIGGITPDCLEIASALYGEAIEHIVPVSSTDAAEMVKLLENTFRAVNIALVNEVAIMCDKLGLNVWEVVEAAATKPYGFMKFTPGPGVGGHCIPLDPYYLAWKLKTLNYNARFIQLAGEINTFMPYYVVEKVGNALNEVRKAVRGSRVLLLGVTYKPNISDLRESPALDIIRLLEERGAIVSYHDPFVPHLKLDGEMRSSVMLDEGTLSAADCVVVTTDHDAYDWPWILGRAELVVDTRNATDGLRGQARVVRL